MAEIKQVDQDKRALIRIYQAIAGGLTLSILLFYLGHLHGKSCIKEYVYVDMDRIVQAIGTSLDSGNLQQDELYSS